MSDDDVADHDQSTLSSRLRDGTKTTPAHRFTDFTIRSYAPVAFRHFRELFNIKPDEFLVSADSAARADLHPSFLRSIPYAVRYEN